MKRSATSRCDKKSVRLERSEGRSNNLNCLNDLNVLNGSFLNTVTSDVKNIVLLA